MITVFVWVQLFAGPEMLTHQVIWSLLFCAFFAHFPMEKWWYSSLSHQMTKVHQQLEKENKKNCSCSCMFFSGCDRPPGHAYLYWKQNFCVQHRIASQPFFLLNMSRSFSSISCFRFSNFTLSSTCYKSV